MTQDELLQALMVERYQPRYLVRDGEPMPSVPTFDEFIASLRVEAKKPVTDSFYARTRTETIRWQNEEADEFIARRVAREKELEKVRAHDARRRNKKKTPRLDEFGKVKVALAQGQSLRDALTHLQGGK